MPHAFHDIGTAETDDNQRPSILTHPREGNIIHLPEDAGQLLQVSRPMVEEFQKGNNEKHDSIGNGNKTRVEIENLSIQNVYSSYLCSETGF